MIWKIWLWQVFLGLIWVYLIDAYIFPNENLFLFISVIFFVGFPLASFLFRLTNIILTNFVLGNAIEETVYQAWIDAQMPLIDPDDLRYTDLEEYLGLVSQWPDASRQQSNTASSIIGTMAGVKDFGMLSAFFHRRLLDRVYRKHIQDNRHIWHKENGFAKYIKDC
ncbi:hypothetical protein N9X06_06655 [Paracoccaceae bacterium]|nr:hypothetical protein [Paracoccaceae bacterium]